ncbi:DJ-1/PfpI family protein [Pantoea agglomerans]|uniref:DJ-1/PfpI family protein n=1 Tax=Enterobacter agglomerans TaxID=549 RepID=UPI002543DC88|nr:DJ-1/PfpI family protein [Pantoea agglomerans]MDK4219014.1 DJ-1/PfpI family protein [Pantoea agglomerans]
MFDNHEISRRNLIMLGNLLTLGSALPVEALAKDSHRTHSEHMQTMNSIPADAPTVGILVYPQMVALDLIGPLTVFKISHFNSQLIWKNTQPLCSDVGLSIVAEKTFAQCQSDFDILFVPGGIMGTIACMRDPQVMDFLYQKGSRAKWVTSVCTGGLVLAAAGLLKGYRATTHWAVADLLPLMGAIHTDQRVVFDGNRITAGGVTAGIDFALELVAKIKGEELAKRVQLVLEYSPVPPFHNGTPQEAGPERTAQMRDSRKSMDLQAKEAALHAANRLGIKSS